MTVAGIPADFRRTPMAATTLDDESRQAAIVEWTHRMGDELVASRLFAGLLPQMMRAGVDAGFQAAAAIKIFLTGPPTAQSNGSAALIL